MEAMDRDDADDVLFGEGFGMLAMSDDDVPYVIPMSFGYDGTDCYVQMTTTGRKNEVLATNDRASLAVLSVDHESGTSESVVVSGTVEAVTGDDVADGLAALAENAHFGKDLTVWGDPVEDVDLALYRLVPETVSGRRFCPEDSGF